jgi:UDP-2,3-diacylglucosamine pyrophosphatase LpxH
MAKEGTKVIYVPGNHDENIREFCGSLFGNVSIRRRHVNACRRACGLAHWSLAAHLKLRLANAVRYVEVFEHAAAQAALSRNLDGIVCGHIHRPGLRQIDGVLYCNDGDWVESCTALVELPNGELSIWHSENPYTRRSAESLFEIAA